MPILSGKPSSISANTTSSTITLSTSDLLNLIDSATTDPYWKDAARIKSVAFVYRNSSRQKVNLKFTLPSTSSTISISENARNGALTCNKIVVTGKANDILVIPRSSFVTADEFDMSVTGGYVSPTLLSLQPITWTSPLTSTTGFPSPSGYLAESDGGIYKNSGPGGMMGTSDYDLSVRSSQELPSTQGYIEIDAIRYTYTTQSGPSVLYGIDYVVGLSSGSRDSTGGFSNIDFAVQFSNVPGGNLSSLQNGGNVELLPITLQEPQPGYGGPGTGQTSYKNKIRIQFKNGDVEYFVNNIKLKTLPGALASLATPVFAEVSLKNPYLSGQPTTGSGFPSSRISSTYSVPGTIIRSADFAAGYDPDVFGISLPGFRGGAYYDQFSTSIVFGEGQSFLGPTLGAAISIRNVGHTTSTGDGTFAYPLVEGNNYIIRIYISGMNAPTLSPSLSVLSWQNDPGLATVSNATIQSAIGSYVDIPYTSAVFKDTNINPPIIISDFIIISNDTDATNTITISKVEIIEA